MLLKSLLVVKSEVVYHKLAIGLLRNVHVQCWLPLLNLVIRGIHVLVFLPLYSSNFAAHTLHIILHYIEIFFWLFVIELWQQNLGFLVIDL